MKKQIKELNDLPKIKTAGFSIPKIKKEEKKNVFDETKKDLN